MEKVEIAGLSKRQLSRLKNKRPVRCVKAPCPMNGKGHIVLMDTKKCKKCMSSFKKGKGINLQLNDEEVKANMEGEGLFSVFKKVGRTIGNVGKKVGSTVKNVATKSIKEVAKIGKEVGKVVAPALKEAINIAKDPRVAKVLSEGLKQGIDIASDAGLTALIATNPELAPLLPALMVAKKELTKIAKKETDEAFKPRKKTSKKQPATKVIREKVERVTKGVNKALLDYSLKELEQAVFNKKNQMGLVANVAVSRSDNIEGNGLTLEGRGYTNSMGVKSAVDKQTLLTKRYLPLTPSLISKYQT